MEYLFTERAHLMCPHMCFGIVVEIKSSFDESMIKRAFDILEKRHPFLRAHLGYEESGNRYFYDVMEDVKSNNDKTSNVKSSVGCTELIIRSEEYSEEALMQIYDQLTGRDWNLFNEGMLKAVIWRRRENTEVLLLFHHLLADGRGALMLAEELADIYVSGNFDISDQKVICEKLISSKADLPEDSEMPFISRALVKKANRDWTREGKRPLSYEEYHQYADEFLKRDKVKVSKVVSSKEELTKVIAGFKEEGVTVNDYLMAKMFTEEDTDKIIIACDLRNRLKCYNPGALGNYSTAFSVSVKKKREDIYAVAREVRKKVQKVMNTPRDLYLVLQCYAELCPEVLDAAFMAATGGYDSKAASFIGKMFFGFESPAGYSITNLGKIENENMVSGAFIPPASPAIKKTWGVLTVNGTMTTYIAER